MTAFSALAPQQRLGLAGLLFLAASGQLALCLYQALCRSGRARRVSNGGAFLALLFGLAYVRAAAETPEAPAAFPWLLLPLLSVITLLHAALGIRREYRESRETLSPASVRQALDDLNSGILFADRTGRAVLVNYTMGRLAAALLGSFPQTAGELDAALRSPPAGSGVERLEGEPALYRFPDGRVWRFRTMPLTDPLLAGFTQTTAQDLTELAEVNAQLERENAVLRAAIRRMQGMVERISSLVPQQEMLSLKIRVHNDIGASLIALSELVRNGTQEETDAQVRVLSDALRYFAGSDPAARDTLADVRRQTAAMRAELRIEGAVPRSRELESLIAAAASECVTNCVRHAGGSRVDVQISGQDGRCTVRITNDGAPPERPIAEGGGLTSLRRKIESVGGEMYVTHEPRFALILELPEGGTDP